MLMHTKYREPLESDKYEAQEEVFYRNSSRVFLFQLKIRRINPPLILI
jgi:hypothetical protein